MFASFVLAALFIAAASADHAIILRNNCPWGVGMIVSDYPNTGPAYGGNISPNIDPCKSVTLTVPSGWNDNPPNSGCENNCFGGIAFDEAACSMAECNFDSGNIGSRTDYDISNIQGYSVVSSIICGSPPFGKAQQILPPGGAEVVPGPMAP
ncbi:hypothetical protein C8R45DRAFT_1112977 [Mycena sanguinolenta]|nr:hypothetical protein C8R45DRAFT_1112977 [Mycena sanguinolenta]